MNRHRELAQMMRAAAGPPPGEIPTNGLVNWWKFDEGTGSTVTDYGTASVNAILEQNATPAWDPANWLTDPDLGRTVYQNQVSLNNAVNITGIDFAPRPLTFVYHVKNTVVGNGNLRIMDINASRLILQVNVTSTDNTIRFYDFSSWNDTVLTSGMFDIGSWHQAAIVIDDSISAPTDNEFVYVDGSQFISLRQAATIGFNSASRLGAHNTGTTDFADGLEFADVLFYNRVLSLSELAEIRDTVLGGN